MKTLITLFILAVSIACKAQTPDLTNWKLDSLPLGAKTNSANLSANDWIFTKNINKWEIIRNDYKREKGNSFPFSEKFISENLKELQGNKFIKKIKEGFLVGINKGEFGGGLYFVKDNGLAVYQISGNLNIKGFFEFNNRIFAIEGLAHMGLNRGKIIEIFKEDKTWKCKSITDLIETPAIIADYKDEKIIVTSQYILKLDKQLNIFEVLKSPFYWGILYPSSILVDNDNLYLSMREGILKIKEFDTAPEYEWYIPK
ncbi:hypothetical protein [Pedobacter cryophilus]|uniref:Uncharacterized protein n=1 Tax=Pedobacter cryophilus TaxID=2571271 RepID=A0A4U1BUD8_9SPHI|nr:hypothetical protein [Pedobacter cryophilus]TKB96292.1 hypothetical protein FA046_13990 [Pedobacter cryophilus]